MSRHIARVLLGDQVWIVTELRAYRIAVGHTTGRSGFPLLRNLPADEMDPTDDFPVRGDSARWATALDLAVRDAFGMVM